MNKVLKPTSRSNNILTQEIADEFLIYDLDANKAYSLNRTSSLIWRMCDGKKSLAGISDALGKELRTPVDEEVIWLAVNQFKEDGLLEDNESKIPNVYGMSRRQIIKKVGFTTAVALPLISSLIAPSAAAAQSGCAPMYDPCAIPSDCCSNSCFSGVCF